ncbi:hypothetical protein KDK77_01855 [bacterium]|nr:hypothetical protein [bacterium]
MNRVAAGILILAVMWMEGCASTHSQGKTEKLFEPHYKAVSGNVYEYYDVKITVDVPLRTFGSETYFYALKKSPSPLVSPEKYLIFDIMLYNPQRRTAGILYESVVLVGQNQTKYQPLQSIKPDTNKTRFLMRNLDEFRSSPSSYGIFAFEPLPDWEKEIKLQFQIEIDGEIEHHFVIFRLNEPSQQALADWSAVQQRQHVQAQAISDNEDESGFLNPSALDEIKKLDPTP